MLKKLCCWPIFILTLITLAVGCKPKTSGQSPSPGSFQTQFQSESQFIVEAVVSDIAEQIYYTAFHKLPDKRYFSVTALEKNGSSDTPVYQVQIRLDHQHRDIKSELKIVGPIWATENYATVAKELANAVDLKINAGSGSEDATFLSTLTDSLPETIEQENQDLSKELENDFGNPDLHEKAGALLGAFLLRDHSGWFFEIRTPLSRMTAHLAMARCLRGSDSFGINGRVADTILLTLIGNQAAALNNLNDIGTNNTAAMPFVRALRARNTGDYRPLDQSGGLTGIESIEWFGAKSDFVAAPAVWSRLSDSQKQTIDFVRFANTRNRSIEIGHELLETSIALEVQEISRVYQLSRHERLSRAGFVKALNELPERGFITEPGGKVHVCVISWGQWAMFLQRHLCDSVVTGFDFMQVRWGVPDDAKTFAAACDKAYGELRLYPFVQLYNCTDVATYHKSVDDGFSLITSAPHLIPAHCWARLAHPVSFTPMYRADDDMHVGEWYNHDPLPGTVYDLDPRMLDPCVVDDADALLRFDKLRELSPYDCRILNFISGKRYENHPTYDQAAALYRDVLPYSLFALTTVAYATREQPELYEKLMLQAAQLDPSSYYELGDYVLARGEEDRAAEFYDKGCATDQDGVRVASRATWRIRYCLKKGQLDKASEIADFAGEVYSKGGLEAKAIFMESTKRFDEAFAWYAKIEDRYGDASALINFCQRYQAATGSHRFEPELKKRTEKVLPKRN